MKRLAAILIALAICLSPACPVLAAGETAGFMDVSPRDYFYDAVLWARDADVTNGITETEFGPRAFCTRGQVVTFLWRAMGRTAPTSSENPFVDVRPSDYFYEPVLWAVEQGIAQGVTATEFRPASRCTGAQVLTFLWRALKKPAADPTGTPAEAYPDGAYYKIPAAWAEKTGLFVLNSGDFLPDAFSPRADIVTWLYLALDHDVMTPARAVAGMSGWGVNIPEPFEISPTSGQAGSPTGYFVERPMTEPFGLALNFWDGGFDWIAYHEPHEKVFTSSAPMPDYDPSKPVVDWVNALFFAEFFTDRPNAELNVTLKNSRIVLSDGSAVPIPVMDGEYTAVTGSEADPNGWYRAELDFDRSLLPSPSARFDGARVETTVVSDTAFSSPEDKADYCFQLDHIPYDMEKSTDIFLDEGINVIRLPVTWTPFVNDTTFEIDRVWLERVAEEVDYILQNNAYCILDVHFDYLGCSYVGDRWDTEWMDAEHRGYVDRRFAAIWTQIAEYFKNYPRKLMFEAFNEPCGEVASESEAAKRVNELNELFVNTVRATGGKNRDRILSVVPVAGIAPNLEALTPPDDPWLVAQVHVYLKMEEFDAGFGSPADTDRVYSQIDAFTARTGVPVIIGEAGISHADPETAHLDELSLFLKEARLRGIPVLWWEDYFTKNESNGDQLFWLYDKSTDRWGRPQLLAAIKEALGG